MNQQVPNIEEHLLLQYLLGELQDTERVMIEEWLRESEANRAMLDRLEALWLETGKLDPPPLAVDIEAAWKRVSNRMLSEETRYISSVQTRHVSSLPHFSSLRQPFRIAATILLLIGISAAIYLMIRKENLKEIRSEYAVLQDTLPDGSVIILNKQSTLSYQEKFDRNIRKVKLSGEAIFKVAKDPDRPFIIDAGIASVRVVGTVFDLKAYPGKNLIVTVTEGKVLLYTVRAGGDTASLLLTAGQSGIVGQGKDHPEMLASVKPDHLFWAERELEFSATPLSEVFTVLEKNYGIKIKCDNPDILKCRITASFFNDPPERILSIICESFGLTFNYRGNIYQIQGNGCR